MQLIFTSRRRGGRRGHNVPGPALCKLKPQLTRPDQPHYFGSDTLVEGEDMKPQTIKPTVNAAREFKEIASDFGSPLDLLRESISNSFDAKASHIKLTFSTVEIRGRSILKIVIEDNGLGMDLKGLQSFFDLGNSFHHDDKERSKKEGLDDATLPIGEKGHGTKVFLNSSHVTVATSQNGKKYVAEMMDPYAALSDDKVPFAEVQETETTPGDVGTTITILGYNHDQTELFNHERLKDHIRWFTKFGSSEAEFEINIHKEVKLGKPANVIFQPFVV